MKEGTKTMNEQIDNIENTLINKLKKICINKCNGNCKICNFRVQQKCIITTHLNNLSEITKFIKNNE